VVVIIGWLKEMSRCLGIDILRLDILCSFGSFILVQSDLWIYLMLVVVEYFSLGG
jgi:hypothetical protein